MPKLANAELLTEAQLKYRLKHHRKAMKDKYSNKELHQEWINYLQGLIDNMPKVYKERKPKTKFKTEAQVQAITQVKPMRKLKKNNGNNYIGGRKGPRWTDEEKRILADAILKDEDVYSIALKIPNHKLMGVSCMRSKFRKENLVEQYAHKQPLEQRMKA